MRRHLQKLIFESWNKCIEKDYINQRINSERSLQASFLSCLKENLPENKRIFIESPLKIKTRNGIKKIIPDIIICNTKEVISVIELKYRPRAQPKYKKDIKSLAFISKKRHKLSISNKRFRGDKKERTEYPLSNNILFVWACVHAKEKSKTNKLFSTGYKSLADCYIQLHAETEYNNKPNVYML